MTKEERIQDIKEEIEFFQRDLEELLLQSDILTNRKRLAIWTNIRRLEYLYEKLVELEKE